MSAVEGVKVAAPQLSHWVVPIAAVIILLLFAFQNHGTGKVGAVFGPIMTLWFVTLAVLGIIQIAHYPEVLKALSPFYGINFFMQNGMTAFFALGSVVLCITGAEALYADMGHFGATPIRWSWYRLRVAGTRAQLFRAGRAADRNAVGRIESVLSAGAGCAAVSDDRTLHRRRDHRLAGGDFRRVLGRARSDPARLSAAHGNTAHVHAHIGQIYLPWINRMLLVLTLAVVIGFRSSENLAAAYGIAVVGTMTIDSILVMFVFRNLWHWPWWKVITVGGLFLVVDLSFLGGNADKVEHGGWLPLALGISVFLLMSTWRRGRELVIRELKQSGLALEPFIASLSAHPPLRVPGTAVFLTANANAVPNALLHNLKHNKVLHERNVLLTVETLETPVAEYNERTEITALGGEFYRLTLRFGFSEDQDIPVSLARCETKGLDFDMMDTTFFISRETVVATDRPGMPLWRDKLFAFLARNSNPATAFFRIPGNRLIELGTQVEI